MWLFGGIRIAGCHNGAGRTAKPIVNVSMDTCLDTDLAIGIFSHYF
jgi:hypothetical protein